MKRALTRAALLAALSSALLTAAAGCGDDSEAGTSTVRVVATTTQAADLVGAVGGDRVEVTGLLPANADPHDYEVRPSDVEALADADLVVRSGGELDEWLQGAIDSAGGDAPVLTLIDRVRPAGGDPHWWHDPRYGQRAVAAVRDALTRADPPGRSAYADAARAYTSRLQALDAAIARCVAGLPRDQRKLVTTHDALAPFARRYGIELVGTVIPARTTQAQPSAGDVANLVERIRRERVRAIFTERSLNPKVEQAIARETGARLGAPLWADALGPPGSGAATYLDSLRANAEAIVAGLSGGERTCSLPR
jgi:ABC-type Zn uptake system ZnuABC Zn-binding protein ZnuA